ncbi:MAG: hypothetical protein ACRELA_15055 [Candidatus Rokuibacteriota bacterium]
MQLKTTPGIVFVLLAACVGTSARGGRADYSPPQSFGPPPSGDAPISAHVMSEESVSGSLASAMGDLLADDDAPPPPRRVDEGPAPGTPAKVMLDIEAWLALEVAKVIDTASELRGVTRAYNGTLVSDQIDEQYHGPRGPFDVRVPDAGGAASSIHTWAGGWATCATRARAAPRQA